MLYVWARKAVFEAKCPVFCTKDPSSLLDSVVLWRLQFQIHSTHSHNFVHLYNTAHTRLTIAMTEHEHEMWNDLNLEYEAAYQENPYKKALIHHAIQNLASGSRVLDIGCGTGVPVAQMLDAAGMSVVGTDVAPQMVRHARERCGGTFHVVDMVDYEPQGTFDAVFIIYSHLGLTYSAFHRVVSRVVQALAPNGLLAIGQSPADKVPYNDSHWDQTHTYLSGYNLPFWGQPFATLMLTRQGQRGFLESAGLEIIYDTLDVFQPNNPNCAAEKQHYIMAKRKASDPVFPPQPFPEREDF